MIDGIAAALAVHGLMPRGGFAFGPGEPAPGGASGRPARAVLLVGHAGGAIWRHFSRWRAVQPADTADPLDRWSRNVIGEVAAAFGARAVSPSDRPYLPFQTWAIRAEGLRPSPLGILMHPQYGLWHAYRGALLFEDETAAVHIRAAGSAAVAPIHLCDGCAEKPCLSVCPVGAHAATAFDHDGCLAHVRSEAGGPCRDAGCLDRNACPVGTSYRYPAAIQAFLMTAFAR
jgi:hypothetical protein